MLMKPKLGSCVGSTLFGTRYTFSKMFSFARPAGDKLPSSCLNVSHFLFRKASNSSAVLDPTYCWAVGGFCQLGFKRQVLSTILRGKNARSEPSIKSRFVLFCQEIKLASICFKTPILTRVSFLKAFESFRRIETRTESLAGCNATKMQRSFTSSVMFEREYSPKVSSPGRLVSAKWVMLKNTFIMNNALQQNGLAASTMLVIWLREDWNQISKNNMEPCFFFFLDVSHFVSPSVTLDRSLTNLSPASIFFPNSRRLFNNYPKNIACRILSSRGPQRLGLAGQNQVIILFFNTLIKKIYSVYRRMFWSSYRCPDDHVAESWSTGSHFRVETSTAIINSLLVYFQVHAGMLRNLSNIQGEFWLIWLPKFLLTTVFVKLCWPFNSYYLENSAVTKSNFNWITWRRFSSFD